jgi:hypothetical protein
VNSFFQSKVEKRLEKMVFMHCRENLEFSKELDTILLIKIEEIISDAFLESKNDPRMLNAIFMGIKSYFYNCLKQGVEDKDIEENQMKAQLALLMVFAQDFAFFLMKKVYNELYQCQLHIPGDVEKRLEIRFNNYKRTGKLGINPEGTIQFSIENFENME